MSPAAGRPAASTSKVDLGSGKFEDEEAVEVLREEEKWFGRSSEIRQQRPKDLEFRVGQVVRHTEWGWRGVITGWDKQAKVLCYIILVEVHVDTSYNTDTSKLYSATPPFMAVELWMVLQGLCDVLCCLIFWPCSFRIL